MDNNFTNLINSRPAKQGAYPETNGANGNGHANGHALKEAATVTLTPPRPRIPDFCPDEVNDATPLATKPGSRIDAKLGRREFLRDGREDGERIRPARVVTFTMDMIIDPLTLLKDTSEDPPGLIGPSRFLNMGHYFTLVGPSGIGKSTLVIYLLACLAVGRDCFGLRNYQGPNRTPRPIRIALLEDENDIPDLRNMVQGIALSLGEKPFTPEEEQLLSKNLMFVHQRGVRGPAFLQFLSDMLAELKAHDRMPEILVCDPLLSYFGGDLNSNKELSQFLRDHLRDVLLDYPELCFGWVHHTGKASSPKDAMGQLESALQHVGLGGSELANWSRAMIVLTEEVVPEGWGKRVFKLSIPKRGTRAGLCAPDGELCTACYLEWSEVGQGWMRSDYDPDTAEAEAEAKKEREREEKARKRAVEKRLNELAVRAAMPAKRAKLGKKEVVIDGNDVPPDATMPADEAAKANAIAALDQLLARYNDHVRSCPNCKTFPCEIARGLISGIM